MRLILCNAIAVQMLLYGVKVWGVTISLSAWNEIEELRKMFLRREWGVKSSTSYCIMLLEIGARPIEVLVMPMSIQVYHKVKNMPDHRLPRQARNIQWKVQKINKSKITSFGQVLDIMRWFKR